jgi:glycine/D-amino acid oxidase-like deaminating enzyme/nitrite reductase/ring-hydroxylating ferredoxin subunit
MTSLWLDRPEPIADDVLPAGDVLDVVVVGAGVTGLTTALLLARAGRRVAVVEARTVGAVTTGNTTGKVSLLQGTKLSRMRRFQSRRVLQSYVDGSHEGQQWLLRFCEDHDVPFQVRDAVTYASSPQQRSALQRELGVANEVGLDARLVDALDVPFPQFGAVVLPDQAQLDAMDVLSALVDQVRAHGGSVHQGHRVVGVSRSGRPRLTLDDGAELLADHVVLATGSPILDRGLYFAKLEPLRSYALAFDVPAGALRAGMYLSAGEPSRSIRSAPGRDGEEHLVVGGNGHDVGRTRSELSHLDELRTWTAKYFPGATETHAWSAQDYRSHDSFPYVGPMPRGGRRIFVATGLDKWGLTGGVAAARSISEEILGGLPSWQRPQRHRMSRPNGLVRAAVINAEVGVAAVGAGLAAVVHTAPTTPPAEGKGSVGRRGVVPTGTSTVDGTTCSVVALCTHLGGPLTWNDAERSWDCPLHGSRFDPDGTVLEGPATRPLARRDEPGEA